jgi:hypothetical protein
MCQSARVTAGSLHRPACESPPPVTLKMTGAWIPLGADGEATLFAGKRRIGLPPQLVQLYKITAPTHYRPIRPRGQAELRGTTLAIKR